MNYFYDYYETRFEVCDKISIIVCSELCVFCLKFSSPCKMSVQLNVTEDVGPTRLLSFHNISPTFAFTAYKERAILNDDQMTWTCLLVASVTLCIIALLCCLCWIKNMGIRRNAYGNLARSGFFEMWLIRDLHGLSLNPEYANRH